jgi:quercetin dioxygenase-like cupin family protein
MIKLVFMAAVMASLVLPPVAATEDVPDALSVEWQGEKPCEKLHEDDQIRILRCTFPPGAKHMRHQHPANFVYALSGGKLNTESVSGTREAEVSTDAYVLNKRVPCHEVTITAY